jgi:Helix-turn-helix domain/RodZ C-terminal domain
MFEIGSSLREARTRQGLEIPEFETRTKIRGKYLRALEADQFEVLPGHTYVKGFLRTYADALGLDGQLYVDEYNSRYVPGEDEAVVRSRGAPTPGARRRRRERRESHVVVVAVAAIGLVAALVIAAWKFGGPEPQSVRGLDTAGVVAPTAPTARRVTVELRAARGDSFMEVRSRTRAGRPLYRGTLERGQTQRFVRQRSVYVSLGSPDNVVVRVNGNRVAFPNGGEAIITPRGLREAT